MTHHHTDREIEERKQWDAFFSKGSSGRKYFERHITWYEASYASFRRLIEATHDSSLPLSVLEVGCGSGMMAFSCVAVAHRLTLLDVSKNALRYAAELCPPSLTEQASYVQASIFALPFPNRSFDFVHSTGVLEHYSERDVLRAVAETERVTRSRGKIIHVIPNPWSLPVLKARLLGSSFGRTFLSVVPGYRNDTERPYTGKHLQQLLSQVYPQFASRIVYFGPACFTGWSSNRFMTRIGNGSKLSFLTGVILEKP